MIIYPEIFKDQPIVAAQSTRQGGVSAGAYASMNLGMSVNDLKENVIKNREIFFGKSGIQLSQLVISKQVHGNSVFVANTPTITEGYDALITDKVKKEPVPARLQSEWQPIEVYFNTKRFDITAFFKDSRTWISPDDFSDYFGGDVRKDPKKAARVILQLHSCFNLR